ncbi:uncharacterized membrane protein YhaH (DUF805 family) [Weissella uvarum]|uniref:DUF805 domain-containing protein n=1 Tax=Weissella uvarum TaxID=1479233 RepID=UPI00195FFF31|nr:DUF805 domain-containing protein [Weissella uvarum]MBM7616559.1 uncharacterized membrane protein YhaH (DUF805 family) [Weissella uvarum]MCM0594981.1 DUF805 domain-containing protein [Weissella uvarum]
MEYLLAYLNELNGFKFGRLFSFKGDLDRESFFLGGLAWVILVSLVVTPIVYLGMFAANMLMMSGNFNAAQSVFYILAALLILIAIVVIVQALAAMKRRLHDAGVSGYYLLFWIVPILGAPITLWHAIKPSQGQSTVTEA